jgi:hypothetical protein
MLLDWDGVDGIDNTQAGLRFSSAAGNGLIRAASSTTPVMPNGRSFSTSFSTTNRIMFTKAVAEHATGFFGQRLLHTTSGGSFAPQVMFGFGDVANTPHFSIAYTVAGRLQIVAGFPESGSPTVLATSSFFVDNARVYFLQVGYTIAGAGAGSVTLRWTIDGVETTEVFTGITTRGVGAGTTVGVILWGSGGGTVNPTFDDWYLCDNAGAAPYNSFLGAVRALMLLPNGAGDSAQFTPSAGANWQCVDEDVQNGDTDFVESNTLNHKDLYNIQEPDSTATVIYAVRVSATARYSSGGARNIRLAIKSGSTEAQSGELALGATYRELSHQWLNNPATSAPWTIAQLNSLQVGQIVGT